MIIVKFRVDQLFINALIVIQRWMLFHSRQISHAKRYGCFHCLFLDYSSIYVNSQITCISLYVPHACARILNFILQLIGI